MTYTMVDAALSAFAVFFLQSPSFLEYPRNLEQTRAGEGGTTPGRCSGPTKSPRTTRSAPCSTLPIPPQSSRYFRIFFIVLEQAGVVDSYRSMGGTVLLARDGTAYCSSPESHGAHYSTRRHTNGKVTYYHGAPHPRAGQAGGVTTSSRWPRRSYARRTARSSRAASSPPPSAG
jgi:hypothetical protein